MNPTRMQTQAVRHFKCLGPECPDTCCAGWSMQLTPENVARYEQQAPELLAAVEADGDAFVMRRDPATSDCVKFEQGLCAIQRDYGEEMLGDACYFFPRITRALGTTLLTTLSLACPEAARLMLFNPQPFALGERTQVRTPYTVRNYLPKEIDDAAGLGIHVAFMELVGDESIPAAHSLMRISAVARGIEMQPVNAWAEALPLYCSMADSRIPTAEPAAVDLFNLCHALRGLVMASASPNARLMECVGDMAHRLGASFTADGAIVLADDAAQCAVRALATMRQQAPLLEPIFRRYLQAQISASFFPFSGLGATLSERLTIIGVRYATVRLALATLGDAPTQEGVVRIIQTLSRFSDHLADPALSLSIYRETGWVRESRLRSIIGA